MVNVEMEKHFSLLGLLGNIDNCSSMSRYVLLKLVFRTYANEPIDVGNLELAAAFGISVSKFIEAKRELIAAGILRDESEKPSGRCRPKLRLRWGAELDQTLITQMVSGFRYASAINSLLRLRQRPQRSQGLKRAMSGDICDRMKAARREQKISPTNCLLIAVLWLYADEYGVVERVGTKELVKVTGVNKDGLKTRFNKLPSEKLIRTTMPGGYSKLLGGRIQTTYILNSNHPYLGGAEKMPKCLDLSLCKPDIFGRMCWPWSYQEHKYEVQKFPSRKHDLMISPLDRYHWVLYATEDKTFFRHLPFLLSRYALQVLTNETKEVRSRAAEVIQFLGPKIVSDFHLPRKTDGRKWARFIYKFNLTDEPEPELRLAMAVEADGREKVEDFTDLKNVVSDFVRFIVDGFERLKTDRLAKLFTEHHIDWNDSRLVWLSGTESEEGFFILMSAAA